MTSYESVDYFKVVLKITKYLVAFQLLVVLYASSILRFGLSQQFTYILYTIARLNDTGEYPNVVDLSKL